MGIERTNDTLTRDLRHALSTEADAAPLPDGVLHVPAAWIRRRSITEMAGKPMAFAITVAVGALLVLQLARLVPIPTVGMSPTQAARLAGVPRGQVVPTEDGYVAISLERGPQPTLRLLLVPTHPDSGSIRSLGFASLAPPDLMDTVAGMSTFRLSCAASSGLAQPDFVFGEVQFAPDPPKGVTLHAPSSGTVNGTLFLFALDPGSMPPGPVDVTTSSPKSNLAAAWTIPAGSFDHTDSCDGERVRAIEDQFQVPLPERPF